MQKYICGGDHGMIQLNSLKRRKNEDGRGNPKEFNGRELSVEGEKSDRLSIEGEESHRAQLMRRGNNRTAIAGLKRQSTHCPGCFWTCGLLSTTPFHGYPAHVMMGDLKWTDR
jgi:hypothetical protein